jgi:hypothetical protein
MGGEHRKPRPSKVAEDLSPSKQNLLLVVMALIAAASYILLLTSREPYLSGMLGSGEANEVYLRQEQTAEVKAKVLA